MPDNTIEWGQGAVNNTNDWGKAKANATNNFGAVYDDSPSLDTNITGSTGAVLSITYSASAFCEDASDPTPTVSNNVGAGTFSSTTGLVFVSTTTGQVDLSASTSGATYLITYTDTNSATATFSLTVNALDDASFAYSQSSYSPTDADPTPTVTGVAGGTFSAGSGLVFVDSGSNTGSSTGEIDLSASTIATYTITYTTAGTCPNSSTQTVEIASALAQVSNVYSMDFDGTNDYIDLGDNFSFGNGTTDSPFSISAWINMDSVSGFRILSKYNNTSSDYEYSWGSGGSNKLQFFMFDGTNQTSGYRAIVMDTVLNTGQWYHTVVTYDGRGGNNAQDGLNIYVDGTLVSVTNTVVGTYTAMNDLSINTQVGALGTLGYANGKMDEIGIFNVELTAQEIQNIYNATETGKTADLNDLTTPPIKWYRMGD